jgi:hypothetical protein
MANICANEVTSLFFCFCLFGFGLCVGYRRWCQGCTLENSSGNVTCAMCFQMQKKKSCEENS